MWRHSVRMRTRYWLALIMLLSALLTLPPSLARPGTAAAAGPSGEQMPTGDYPDFQLVQAEDFLTPIAIGQWPGPYATGWTAYQDGWPDTAGQGGANSGYAPSKVVSVQDGMLDYYLHSENGRTLSAALLPVQADHLYGRISLRMRADPVQGFKTAFLYWPNSGVWPRDGEIDFPEGSLTDTVAAFMHRQNGTWGGDQDAFSTAARYTEWHTYTIEWKPASVEFFVDGTSIGVSTERIPNTPMHFVLQSERCLNGCSVPANAAGHLQIDWIAVWDYAPGTRGRAAASAPVATTPVAAPGNLVLAQPATPDRASAGQGETIGASARYHNDGGQPVTVNYAALALRGPNGERKDFSPAQGTATTVQPGADLVLNGLVTLPSSASVGTWGVVSTWQDAAGVWHESGRTPLVVTAAARPPASVEQYALTVQPTTGGVIANVSSGVYPARSAVSASAVPAAGYVFTGWRVNGDEQGWVSPLSITIDRNYVLTATFAPQPQFGDLPPQDASHQAIRELAARGIIKGCTQPDQAPLFCPDELTLRTHMAALIVRAMDWGGANPANPFTDRNGVDDELWRAVAILADRGVARGYGDGTYGTTNPVLAAQMVSFVTRAMVANGFWQMQPDNAAYYPSVPTGSGHRQDLVTYAHYAGPVPGTTAVTESYANWDAPSNRAQFAVTLWQALNSYFSADRVP